MNRHHHPSNNAVLGAPAGASIDECHALPITRVRFDHGMGEEGVVSFWIPTAKELELLQAGRPLRLCIMGRTHAPLAIGVAGDGGILDEIR